MIKFNKLKWIFIIPGSGIVVLFLVFAPFIIKTSLCQAFKMPTESMKPTILVGDYFLTDKTYLKIQKIERGDILIFEYPKDPSKIYIKRVIGIPGDTIEIKNKRLYVNNVRYEESYVIHIDRHTFNSKINNRDNFGPVLVPENNYFMMGDNRDRSNDSRFWGFVNIKNIKGRAGLVYWSWDKTDFRIRWSRIGKLII